MNFILTIIMVLSGVAAFVYKLIMDKKSLEDLLAGKEIQAKEQEWADKIKQIDNKVNVDERDYSDAKKKFDSDSNDGSSGNS